MSRHKDEAFQIWLRLFHDGLSRPVVEGARRLSRLHRHRRGPRSRCQSRRRRRRP